MFTDIEKIGLNYRKETCFRKGKAKQSIVASPPMEGISKTAGKKNIIYLKMTESGATTALVSRELKRWR